MQCNAIRTCALAIDSIASCHFDVSKHCQRCKVVQLNLKSVAVFAQTIGSRKFRTKVDVVMARVRLVKLMKLNMRRSHDNEINSVTALHT
jgi:hypothetical protein